MWRGITSNLNITFLQVFAPNSPHRLNITVICTHACMYVLTIRYHTYVDRCCQTTFITFFIFYWEKIRLNLQNSMCYYVCVTNFSLFFIFFKIISSYSSYFLFFSFFLFIFYDKKVSCVPIFNIFHFFYSDIQLLLFLIKN